MLNTETDKLLNELKTNIMNGNYTPAKRVEEGTLVCLKFKTVMGTVYQQLNYDDLADTDKALLLGKYLGDSIGQMKILGVFHVWPSVEPKDKFKEEVAFTEN